MPVIIETVTPCRRKLRVEVEAAQVAGVRAELLQEFRKQATLPGFRPGRAPEPLVEKRYAQQLDDEVRQRVIPDSYRAAVAEQKLHVVGMPQIEKVEYQPGQPLIFTAVVDTAPEFKLPEYKGIAVKKTQKPVTEDEVNQTVEDLREQQAEFVDVTGRPLALGDFAIVNYTGVCDGQPLTALAGEAKTLGEHKDFWLLMTSDAFLPGFCDQLVGTNAGEKKQVLVDFPADFAVKPLAGRKATYFVEVTGIKAKKLPAVDDEFAKRVGAASASALLSEIRKGLEAERADQANGELRKQILDHLLAQVEFELPESLVEQETRSLVYDLVQENTRRGVPKETLEQKREEILAHAAQRARERIRVSFLLEAIAQAEKITVTPAEMEDRLAALAGRYRVTPEKLKAQLDERGRLGEIEEQVLVGKTLDFLIANANVETTKA
jgi:trigger factor